MLVGGAVRPRQGWCVRSGYPIAMKIAASGVTDSAALVNHYQSQTFQPYSAAHLWPSSERTDTVERLELV